MASISCVTHHKIQVTMPAAKSTNKRFSVQKQNAGKRSAPAAKKGAAGKKTTGPAKTVKKAPVQDLRLDDEPVAEEKPVEETPQEETTSKTTKTKKTKHHTEKYETALQTYRKKNLPDSQIRSKTISLMSVMINDLIIRIVRVADDLARMQHGCDNTASSKKNGTSSQKKSITFAARDVFYAARIVLPSGLHRYVDEAEKTVEEYNDDTKRAAVRERAVIPYPRVSNDIRTHFSLSRLTETAPVAMATIVENVVGDVLQSAARITKEQRKRAQISTYDVFMAVNTDRDLARLFSNVVMDNAVVPYIPPSIANNRKKTGKGANENTKADQKEFDPNDYNFNVQNPLEITGAAKITDPTLKRFAQRAANNIIAKRTNGIVRAAFVSATYTLASTAALVAAHSRRKTVKCKHVQLAARIHGIVVPDAVPNNHVPLPPAKNSTKKPAEEEEGGKTRKSHKFRQGTVALRSIRHFQKHPGLITPHENMNTLVRACINQFTGGERLSLETDVVPLIQMVVENEINRLLTNSRIIMSAANISTLNPTHVTTALTTGNYPLISQSHFVEVSS